MKVPSERRNFPSTAFSSLCATSLRDILRSTDVSGKKGNIFCAKINYTKNLDVRRRVPVSCKRVSDSNATDNMFPPRRCFKFTAFILKGCSRIRDTYLPQMLRHNFTLTYIIARTLLSAYTSRDVYVHRCDVCKMNDMTRLHSCTHIIQSLVNFGCARQAHINRMRYFAAWNNNEAAQRVRSLFRDTLMPGVGGRHPLSSPLPSSPSLTRRRHKPGLPIRRLFLFIRS